MRPGASRRAGVAAVTAALLSVALGATAGMAADGGTVDAEVTIEVAAACIELSTSSIGFGTLALGAANAAGTPGITVTNCSEADGTLFASGTDAFGTGATWNLVDSAATCADTLGLDNYHLGLATPAGDAIASLSTENKEVGTVLAAGSTDHVARISTACPGSSGSGQTMTMSINYLATSIAGPPIVLEELTADQATADSVAAYLLPPTKDHDVPASCGADSIACPGGVPSDPLPQVRIEASNVSSVHVAGTLRWNTTATLAVTTLQAIPVTISGVSCDVTVDSGAGVSPTFSASGDLNFQSYPNPDGPTNYVAVANASITGVEAADLTLIGGFSCDLASAFKSSFIPILTDTIEAYIEGNVCGDPSSTSFVPCPPLP